MAGELERLLIRLEADTSILRKALADADKQIAGFGNNVDRQLSRTERRFSQFGSSARRIFAGLSVGYLAKETVQLADTYTLMTNRLKFVTNSSAELEAVQRRLFEIAQVTRGGLRETTELYGRMAFALRDTGVSQSEVLKFTENLNKAIALSGATASEASGALIQLSQGLASGTLRGQELNSILEQLPYVATLIARQLGITTGELKKMGEQGKITGKEVFKAVIDASAEMDAKFARTIPTVQQGVTALSNSLLNFVGRLNESTGAGAQLAAVLQQIAAGLDTIDGKAAKNAIFGGGAAGAAAGVAAFGGRPRAGEWETTVNPNLDETGEDRTVDLAGQKERLDALSEAFASYDRIAKQTLGDLINLDTAPIGDKIDAITDAYNRGIITHRDYMNSMQDVTRQQMSLNDQLLSQTSATLGAMFKESKTAAIAQALINTYQGITQALTLPPPYSFAMAALVGAQGFAQVAAIRSTSKESGGGGGAGASSSGASAGGGGGGDGGGASTGAGLSQTLFVSGLSGNGLWSTSMVRELAEKLVDFQRNGGKVVFGT
jgi:tape measure domain-containing protein